MELIAITLDQTAIDERVAKELAEDELLGRLKADLDQTQKERDAEVERLNSSMAQAREKRDAAMSARAVARKEIAKQRFRIDSLREQIMRKPKYLSRAQRLVEQREESVKQSALARIHLEHRRKLAKQLKLS